MEQGNFSDSPGYRRGVVLGFTVAEIVLLILFALLLALAGFIVSGKAEVEKAAATNAVFLTAIGAVKSSDPEKFKMEVEKVITQQINYESKIRDIEKRVGGRLLPDDVYDTIQSENLDLTTAEGKKRLLDLLIVALDAQRRVKDEGGKAKTGKEIIESCKTGSEFINTFGKQRSVHEVELGIKDEKGKAEHWKGVASQCGLGGTLPPCYRQSVNEPILFLFDVRIKPEGLVLLDTAAEKYRERLQVDFPHTPPLGKPISEAEFRLATFQYLDWGRRKECRFYVTVFDDLPNDKDRLKSSLKAVESNFYKRITW